MVSRLQLHLFFITHILNDMGFIYKCTFSLKFQEEEVKSKYSELHANFKLLCQEQNGQSFESSKGITPTSSTVVEKWENSEIPSKNKYPSKFDLFDCHMTDILSKVRKERQSNVSQNPCFTPLIILMEKSVLLPLRFQVKFSYTLYVFNELRKENKILNILCCKQNASAKQKDILKDPFKCCRLEEFIPVLIIKGLF